MRHDIHDILIPHSRLANAACVKSRLRIAHEHKKIIDGKVCRTWSNCRILTFLYPLSMVRIMVRNYKRLVSTWDFGVFGDLERESILYVFGHLAGCRWK